MPLNIDFQQILLHLLNFAILFTGLYILLYKPVKDFMKKRHDHYSEMDNRTRADLEGAEKTKKEYEDRLATANSEIQEKKNRFEADMNEMKKERIAEAEKEAGKIIANARETAEREKKRIIENADKEAKDIIAEAAENIVNASLSDNFDSFLDKAEGGKQ